MHSPSIIIAAIVDTFRISETSNATNRESITILPIVLTHSKPGWQRVCMLGGIIPPQLEPAGEKATHSFGPSHCIVDGRQKPELSSAASWLAAPTRATREMHATSALG